jgi:hypothetical protein
MMLWPPAVSGTAQRMSLALQGLVLATRRNEGNLGAWGEAERSEEGFNLGLDEDDGPELHEGVFNDLEQAVAVGAEREERRRGR